MNNSFFNGYYLGIIKAAQFSKEELQRMASEIQLSPAQQVRAGLAIKGLYRGTPPSPDDITKQFGITPQQFEQLTTNLKITPDQFRKIYGAINPSPDQVERSKQYFQRFLPQQPTPQPTLNYSQQPTQNYPQMQDDPEAGYWNFMRRNLGAIGNIFKKPLESTAREPPLIYSGPYTKRQSYNCANPLVY